MYSATPIGGSTASERAGSTRSINTPMGTKVDAEYTFCFRTGMGTRMRMEPRTHVRHGCRRHHCPLATGHGRP